MASPSIKLMAVSNVFSRMMHFPKAGDIEMGHSHPYDHATLVGSGSVRVEILDENGVVQATRNFIAPNMVFIEKNKVHKLTALSDNTTCVCIHALRTVDQTLISPDFFIEPVVGGDNSIAHAIYDRCKQPLQSFVN